MKATAKAPANIAFIKYWGKTDPKSRVPLNNSISMNLSNLYSICTVEFDQKLKKDVVDFVGEATIKSREIERIIKVLDRVREKACISYFGHVKTQNNFSKAIGIASSASGFSALSLAALTAAKVKLTEKELSVFARLASGTACRSIPDGFVEWEKGKNSENSFAKSIFPANYWPICDVVVIVSNKMKKISSTEGHKLAITSPFYTVRLKGMEDKIVQVKKFIKERNFSEFGKLVEDEALNMHVICLTSAPPIIYWEPKTLEIMKNIIYCRENREVESYFTIDAGPSVHAICQKKDVTKLLQKLKSIKGIEKVVVNEPGIGARIITTHLF